MDLEWAELGEMYNISDKNLVQLKNILISMTKET